MNIYRQEVRDFIRSAETLLSPASVGEPLTKDECQIVEFYLTALGGHCSDLGYGKQKCETTQV